MKKPCRICGREVPWLICRTETGSKVRVLRHLREGRAVLCEVNGICLPCLEKIKEGNNFTTCDIQIGLN